MKKNIVLFSFVPALLLATLFGAKTLKMSAVASGDLIKASLPAVYYLGADGKRYVFPNDKVYFSWYADFSGVKTISDSELASYQLGGNVTYRPGTRLVKVQSDPRVYAIGAGGTLRWIATESAAIAIFGNDWNKKVDDIPDAFFVNYKMGADVVSGSDYNPGAEASNDSSINVDKELSAAEPVNTNSNANTNTNANANTNTNVNEPQEAVCSPSCGLANVCAETNVCASLVETSQIAVRVVDIDYSDLCFVGDPCSGGNCCSVGSLSFEKNQNFRSIAQRDLYLYGDKQQLCDHAAIGTGSKNDVNATLAVLSDQIAADTGGKLFVGSQITHIYGQIPMSRVEDSCDWWFAPENVTPFLIGQIDSSTDAVIVVGPKMISAGAIPGPNAYNVGPGDGLGGAGYSYVSVDAPNALGKTYASIFTDAINTAKDLSYSSGLFSQAGPIVGNHCRDNKKDFDETGIDCGGSQCRVCY